MYLKQVKIQGFKSFPDKINIEFNPGVTAIVGPNGSGKSNVADAVLWVLGEQSVKNLRGDKMEDVIFSGTDTRKPLGYAQVTLVIDNQAKILPLPYNEVSITRRVYRNGECEYSINQNNCRLKDITELFMDTGVGRDGYSIIGQGKIESILSSKPEERRQIFEEAAGISKYRYKKEEAQKKLKSTHENLLRISDIVSELENQIGPLDKQRKKALEYLEHKEHLKALEINVALNNIDQLKELQKQNEQELSVSEQKLNEKNRELDVFQKKQQEIYERLNQDDEKAEQLRSEILELTRISGAYQQDIALFLNNQEHSKKEIDRLKSEIEGEKLELTENQKQASEIKAKYDALLELKNSAKEKHTHLEQELNRHHLNSQKEEQALLETEQKLNEKQQSLFAVRQNLFSLQSMIDSNAQRLQDASEDYASKSKNEEEIKIKKQEEEKLFSGYQDELNDLLLKQAAFLEKIKQEQENYAKEKEAFDNVRTKLQSIKSEIQLYQNMQTEFEGLGFGAKKILEAHKSGSLKHLQIFGPLPSLIEVPESYATAVEVALATHNQSLVVKRESDAKEAIEFLKKNHCGRVTFLPLESVKKQGKEIDYSEFLKMPGSIGVASSLVKYDAQIKNAVDYCLSKTLVVDNIEHAFIIARKASQKIRIVTLEGELLSPGGSVTGGSNNKSFGILSRKAQIAKLKQKEQEYEKKKSKYEILQREKSETIQKLQREAEEIQTQKTALEQENQSRLKSLDHYALIIDSLDESLRNRATDIEKLKNESNALKERIQECETEIQKTEKEEAELKDSYVFNKNLMSDVLAKREEYNRELISQEMVMKSFEKDLEHVYERKLSSDTKIENLKNSIMQKQEQISQIQETIEEISSDIEFKREQMQGIVEECHEKEEKIQKILEQRGTFSQSIQQTQEKINDLTRNLMHLQKENSDLLYKRDQFDSKLEQVYNELWDEYELTYSSALELKKELGAQDESKMKISKIKSLIKNMGNINLDAIDQFTEVKQRYDFLTAQKTDLEEAIVSLNEMITSMTHVMEKMFTENFIKISKKFSLVFKELFGGGKGELYLTQPEDVLKSPIEIIVQPKGKRLQSISLLSGGEKALSAIAIIFSILYIKPTPFCIFDEIEAALDDSNVYRFASYFKNFTDFTQFILITHRRGTMEACDTLFGITMQEKGVSQLLPLKISDIA